MTYSEFEERLNYYFNSTDERDVYALESILDGKVCPTMSTNAKKELYEILNSHYSEIYTAYTLTKMLKDYDPNGFADVCCEIPEEEQIVINLAYVIFFENAIF